MKKNEIAVRNSGSVLKKIGRFLGWLSEVYEQRIELRREKEAFDFDNRCREYTKF